MVARNEVFLKTLKSNKDKYDIMYFPKWPI